MDSSIKQAKDIFKSHSLTMQQQGPSTRANVVAAGVIEDMREGEDFDDSEEEMFEEVKQQPNEPKSLTSSGNEDFTDEFEGIA